MQKLNWSASESTLSTSPVATNVEREKKGGHWAGGERDRGWEGRREKQHPSME